jgi:DNA-binding FadR family transcriptional regulator
MNDKNTKQPKLAYRLAQAIARDIIDRDWPAGHMIGREQVLLNTYGVSRDPFREAVRILEWQGVVNSVRGAGGGLYVANASQENVASLLRDYLQLTNISAKEVLEACRIFNRLGGRLFLRAFDTESLAALQRMSTHKAELNPNIPNALSQYIKHLKAAVDLTKNPAVSLFVSPVNEILINHLQVQQMDHDTLSASNRAFGTITEELVAALLDRDEASALAINDRFLATIEQIISQFSSDVSSDLIPYWVAEANHKKAQALVYRLKRSIEKQGLRAGDRIGREPDLMQHFQVSRSVFREAIRKLEMTGLVEQRKGRSGGLLVAPASPGDIVAATVIYLGRRGFNYQKFDEARTAIEMAAAELAAQRITDNQRKQLQMLTHQCQQADGPQFVLATMNYYEQVCAMSGNRILSLYAEVIAQSGYFNIVDKVNFSKLFVHIDTLKSSIEQLTKSILHGDNKGSKNAMQKHRNLVTQILDSKSAALSN